MCLKIRNGSTTPSVAEEDIVCYKVLKRRTDVDKNVRYFAPIMDYEYIVGHENRESTGWFGYPNDNMTYSGFHSFEYKSDAIKFIPRLVNNNFDLEGNLVVCKCTIPKNTRYYSGGVLYSFLDLVLPNGYCSEAIRIDEIVNENEE